MELKYTIEILTKDIQEIENLVRKLQISKEESTLEMDLALSKLRKVYEVLSMIRADRIKELTSPFAKEELKAEKPEPIPESKVEAEPEPIPESKVEAEPEPEPIPEPEPEAAPLKAVSKAAVAEKTTKGTISEKFAAESSLNEEIGDKLGNEMEAKVVGQPIDSISRNIGINDRFLIIRELFDGDSDGFSALLEKLDRADGFQNAAALLYEQFKDAPEHAGIEILEGLLKRRFII